MKSRMVNTSQAAPEKQQTKESVQQFLADEAATVAAGRQLGELLQAGMTVFLEGTLGAGKTTLTRGLLNAFGHSGSVKSPTYTLVEPYEQLSPAVYHFDLYRLGDPEELEYMGIRDYFSPQSLCIVEWAERGDGYLPTADIVCALTVCKKPISKEPVSKEPISKKPVSENKETGTVGRLLTVTANTPDGCCILNQGIFK